MTIRKTLPCSWAYEPCKLHFANNEELIHHVEMDHLPEFTKTYTAQLDELERKENAAEASQDIQLAAKIRDQINAFKSQPVPPSFISPLRPFPPDHPVCAIAPVLETKMSFCHYRKRSTVVMEEVAAQSADASASATLIRSRANPQLATRRPVGATGATAAAAAVNGDTSIKLAKEAKLSANNNSNNAGVATLLGAGISGPGSPIQPIACEDRRFRCDAEGCTKAYKNQQGLRAHIRNAHGAIAAAASAVAATSTSMAGVLAQRLSPAEESILSRQLPASAHHPSPLASATSGGYAVYAASSSSLAITTTAPNSASIGGTVGGNGISTMAMDAAHLTGAVNAAFPPIAGNNNNNNNNSNYVIVSMAQQAGGAGDVTTVRQMIQSQAVTGGSGLLGDSSSPALTPLVGAGFLAAGRSFSTIHHHQQHHFKGPTGHNGKHPCQFCPKTYKTLMNLNKHVTESHPKQAALAGIGTSYASGSLASSQSPKSAATAYSASWSASPSGHLSAAVVNEERASPAAAPLTLIAVTPPSPSLSQTTSAFGAQTSTTHQHHPPAYNVSKTPQHHHYHHQQQQNQQHHQQQQQQQQYYMAASPAHAQAQQQQQQQQQWMWQERTQLRDANSSYSHGQHNSAQQHPTNVVAVGGGGRGGFGVASARHQASPQLQAQHAAGASLSMGAQPPFAVHQRHSTQMMGSDAAGVRSMQYYHLPAQQQYQQQQLGAGGGGGAAGVVYAPITSASINQIHHHQQQQQQPGLPILQQQQQQQQQQTQQYVQIQQAHTQENQQQQQQQSQNSPQYGMSGEQQLAGGAEGGGEGGGGAQQPQQQSQTQQQTQPQPTSAQQYQVSGSPSFVVRTSSIHHQPGARFVTQQQQQQQQQSQGYGNNGGGTGGSELTGGSAQSHYHAHQRVVATSPHFSSGAPPQSGAGAGGTVYYRTGTSMTSGQPVILRSNATGSTTNSSSISGVTSSTTMGYAQQASSIATVRMIPVISSAGGVGQGPTNGLAGGQQRIGNVGGAPGAVYAAAAHSQTSAPQQPPSYYQLGSHGSQTGQQQQLASPAQSFIQSNTGKTYGMSRARNVASRYGAAGGAVVLQQASTGSSGYSHGYSTSGNAEDLATSTGGGSEQPSSTTNYTLISSQTTTVSSTLPYASTAAAFAGADPSTPIRAIVSRGLAEQGVNRYNFSCSRLSRLESAASTGNAEDRGRVASAYVAGPSAGSTFPLARRVALKSSTQTLPRSGASATTAAASASTSSAEESNSNEAPTKSEDAVKSTTDSMATTSDPAPSTNANTTSTTNSTSN